MKIVINNCFGGFSLSEEATEYYLKLKGLPCYFYKQTKDRHRDGEDKYERTKANSKSFITFTFTKDLGASFTDFPNRDDSGYFYDRDIARTDEHLIKTVEDLGSKKASGSCAELKIIEIPDDVDWEIDEYDGSESVHEVHRSWS